MPLYLQTGPCLQQIERGFGSSTDHLEPAFQSPLCWVSIRAWLANCQHFPEASRQFLLDTDDRKRLERRGDNLMGAISDIR